jgi:hypothetical protein
MWKKYNNNPVTLKSGMLFKADAAINDTFNITGKIFITTGGTVYLCQNEMCGSESPNKLGFKYSWCVGDCKTEDLRRNSIHGFYIRDDNNLRYTKSINKKQFGELKIEYFKGNVTINTKVIKNRTLRNILKHLID